MCGKPYFQKGFKKGETIKEERAKNSKDLCCHFWVQDPPTKHQKLETPIGRLKITFKGIWVNRTNHRILIISYNTGPYKLLYKQWNSWFHYVTTRVRFVTTIWKIIFKKSYSTYHMPYTFLSFQVFFNLKISNCH